MHLLRLAQPGQVRNWLLVAAVVALATPALAVVKVYNGVPPGGTPGDGFGYTTTLCPTIDINPGSIQGIYTLSDTGGGTVTMVDFELHDVVFTDIGTAALTSVFGPGAFVFVNATPTNRIASLPVSALGSSAPLGSVAWGVISGFYNTGVAFCISSPQTICTSGAMVNHGVTSPLGPVNSATYDLGTWSFNADGDLSASQYIIRTTNGGTSNGQHLIRGAYVGAGVPALPLVGAGVLAIGFLIAGTRSVLRKK